MQAKVLHKTKGSVEGRLLAAMAAVAAGVVIAFAFAGAASAEPSLQPKTTHPVQGREDCQSCHQPGGGVKPSPANHAAYSNAMCLGCHQPAAAAPADPAAPTPPAKQSEPTAQPVPSTQPAVSPQPPPPAQPTAPAAPQDAQAQAAPVAQPACMDCHKNRDLSTTLPNGDKLSLYVDESQMASSVHNGKLSCTDCHSRITGYPHKKIQVISARDYSIDQYEACKRCHFANYTKTLDSMHYKVMEEGNKNAPLCTDCHGFHAVSVPDQPRSKVSQGCAKCHQQVYDVYAKSVHGTALLNDENPDVPVCIDCHGTHIIKDAQSASFRLNSPEMCAKCHSDAAMMGKYNLSPNVFKTYAQDFHGATVALAKKQNADAANNKAVCTDCHGVHDIKSFKAMDQPAVKNAVVVSCQKCHPNASTNYPDAWLGHYELSLEKAPLPWMIRAWYVVFIPFMVGGLLLHIVVDLWRIARNR